MEEALYTLDLRGDGWKDSTNLSITSVTVAHTVWGGGDAVQFCGSGPFI
jgi:hypothetical protein